MLPDLVPAQPRRLTMIQPDSPTTTNRTTCTATRVPASVSTGPTRSARLQAVRKSIHGPSVALKLVTARREELHVRVGGRIGVSTGLWVIELPEIRGAHVGRKRA